MKTPICVLALIGLLPHFLNAQCQTYQLPFLLINSDTHYRGLAQTGTITSGNGQVFLPWQENPALLGQAKDVFSVKSNAYHQVNSVLKGLTQTFIDVNAQRPLSERLALGVDAKFFSTSKISFTDQNGNTIDSGRPLDYAITGSLGYQLNEHWSVGGGMSFIRSNNAVTTLRERFSSTNTYTVNLGVHYQGQRELSEESKMTTEFGLSITNLGPKIDLWQNTGNGLHYLPATLQLGGRLGWEGEITKERSFGLSLMAQIDHSLVPECDILDEDNNGIPDFREWSALRGAVQSFGDHRNGFSGEFDNWIKRVAIHPWVDLNQNWKMGAGIGLFFVKVSDSIVYSTLGMNLAYKNFQLEVSNIGEDRGVGVFDIGWSYSLGYHATLPSS